MINENEIFETIRMIDQENLDIRTITMGISLRDCAGILRRFPGSDLRQNHPAGRAPGQNR
jgi:hypothetical protein